MIEIIEGLFFSSCIVLILLTRKLFGVEVLFSSSAFLRSISG